MDPHEEAARRCASGAVDGRPFYTLKSVGTMKDGVADRFELEIAVRDDPPDPTVVTAKKIKGLVDPVIRPRRLIEQVIVRTERRTFDIAKEDGTRIELAFDTTRFQARGLNAKRTAPRLHEMEAETRSRRRGRARAEYRGSSRRSSRAGRRRSPSSRRRSSGSRSRSRRRNRPSILPSASTTASTSPCGRSSPFSSSGSTSTSPASSSTSIPSSSTRRACRRGGCARRFDCSRTRSPRERRSVFAPSSGGSRRLFGEVRDLDVFLLNLPGVFAKIEIVDAARAARALAVGRRSPRGRARRTPRGARVEKIPRAPVAAPDAPRTRRSPKRPRAPLAVRTVGEAAPGIILAKYAAVIAQGRAVMAKPKLTSFHRLRIQMKRLRYACEFVAPAYEESLQPFIDKTVDIQDCLGELQDTVFTKTFIERIVNDWKGKAVDPSALFLLGEIHQLQGEIARVEAARVRRHLARIRPAGSRRGAARDPRRAIRRC